jgi:sec-independent protein translocase protein TatA
MFGMGLPELLVILVVALVVFGPGKLPELGSALGQGIRDFRKAFEGRDEVTGPSDKPADQKSGENDSTPTA